MREKLRSFVFLQALTMDENAHPNRNESPEPMDTSMYYPKAPPFPHPSHPPLLPTFTFPFYPSNDPFPFREMNTFLTPPDATHPSSFPIPLSSGLHGILLLL